MPIPYTPPRYCPRCETELVKDMFDNVVHLWTATTHCPSRCPLCRGENGRHRRDCPNRVAPEGGTS